LGRSTAPKGWRTQLKVSTRGGKAGRRYEADVVKAPDWFFCVLGLVFAFAESKTLLTGRPFFGRSGRVDRKRLTNCTPKIPGGLGGLAGSLGTC
jgi:hypothetical protein